MAESWRLILAATQVGRCHSVSVCTGGLRGAWQAVKSCLVCTECALSWLMLVARSVGAMDAAKSRSVRMEHNVGLVGRGTASGHVLCGSRLLRLSQCRFGQ